MCGALVAWLQENGHTFFHVIKKCSFLIVHKKFANVNGYGLFKYDVTH